MKVMKKVAVILLAVCLFAAALTGCSASKKAAAVYGSENVTVEEAKIYIYANQLNMESMYQFMILYYYGGYQSFWESYWAENLTEAMQQIYQTRVLLDKAKADGITLTEDDKAALEKRIEHFKQDYAKCIELAGADDALVRKYMEDNMLAGKVRAEFIKDVKTDWDPEDMQRKKFTGVSVSAKTTYTVETAEEEAPAEEAPAEENEEAPAEEAEEESADESAEAPAEEAEEAEEGEEAPDEGEDEPEEGDDEPETASYTEEEQEANLKAAMEKILAAMKDGKTAEEIVTEYADDLTVTVTSLYSPSASKANAETEDGDTSEGYSSYQEFGWEMKTGEVRGEIVTTSSGTKTGYVLYCENDDDPDLRKEAEDEERATREDALFTERFAELSKNAPKYHVYTEEVAKIPYKGSILDSITITGDDWATLEESEDESEEASEE